MNDLKYYRSHKTQQYASYESSYINKETNSCRGFENLSMFLSKKKNKVRKKILYKTQPTVIYHLTNFGSFKSRKHITKQASTPEIYKKQKINTSIKPKSKSSNAIPQRKCTPCTSNFLLSEHTFRQNQKYFTSINRPSFKVYRCQLTSNVAENCNNCCCSCNSDTMFQVMKELYDCYKKRNCDNCNCILCCHLPEAERLDLGILRPEVNLETALKEVAMKGFALPEGKTASEKKLIENIRKVLGLPPEPISQPMRDKYTHAANGGLMIPLEGKTKKQKEKILRGLHNIGIPLPEGRTPSEEALISKIKELAPEKLVGSELFQKGKRSKPLSIFEGKSPEEVEKILRDMAMQGINLPEGETPSQAKLINKVRTDLGLPPEPTTSALRKKYSKAADDGILLPLEGKNTKEKEQILRFLNDRGIPLPEGRTPSEKALINKILLESPKSKLTLNLAQEKKLRDLAMKGIPLPEGKTDSEKQLLKKVRADLGLPPEPKSQGMRDKYNEAAAMGLLLPLEGKSAKEKNTILTGLANMGIPLPKGRTPSEKALIANIKGQPRDSSMLGDLTARKIDSSKIVSLLEGKSPEEMDKILRKLAMRGIPLPEGRTASQKKLINKIRFDLGLPPEPKTPAIRDKHKKAAEERVLLPLEGKSPEEKEVILQGLLNMDIPLPKARTPSEKKLIAKVRERYKLDNKTSSKIEEREGPVDECICGLLAPPLLISFDIKRKAKAAENNLEGKTPSEKEKILRDLAYEGIPLPKGKTESEKNLIREIRNDLGLPPEPKTDAMKDKHLKAAENNLLIPLKGLSPEEKEKNLRGLLDLGIPLPKARTPSEKLMMKKLKLEHKSPSGKIREAKAAGLLTPLEGKTPSEQEDILRGLVGIGLPLPQGKTDSQKKLLNKIRIDIGLPPEPETASMKIKYAKAADAGLLQPLENKTPKEKEKILRGLIDLGIPLPKGRSHSEKSLINKLQRQPKSMTVSKLTPSEKMRGAKAAGLLTPLSGKTPSQKQQILKRLAEHGMALPEGKTDSEKIMISNIRINLGLPPEPKTSSMRQKYAEAADMGLMRPLEGKTPQEKEKLLRRLAEAGIPLPKARTPSEKALINKIKGEPQKRTFSEKMRKAYSAGLLTPLEGKSPADIDAKVRKLADLGVPIPEGQTASQKKLINNIRLELGLPPEPKTPAMRKKYEEAAAAGLLLPLEGKSPKEKKKILQGLADLGIPLPVGRTDSEKKLIDKVNEKKMVDLKPSEVPESISTTQKLKQAKAAGLLTPLETKSPKEKEKILRNLAKLGVPLPEGKTPSEKLLVNKLRKEYGLRPESSTLKIRKADAAGFLTPLDGKTPEQKEKILRGRAAAGLPLPKGKSPSEKELINQIKASPGYVTPSPSKMLQKARAAGLLPVMEGKTPLEKEKVLRKLEAAGIPLPEGTPSEKIKKLNALQKSKSEKMKAARAAGLLTPLSGKTPEQKEKILKGLVENGLPLPEGQTKSEKALIDKFRTKMGLPPTPTTPFMQEKYKKAQDAGIITPLEGKTMANKEIILKKLHKEGIPLPVGRTSSEKSLIQRVKARLSKPRTPFEEMTPAKKEKVLRGLVKSGGSLPIAKTPSGIELMNKIRKDMGLPPEPKTTSMKEKMSKAYSAGLITPLEGKTSAQKEKILRGLAEAGIPLPEGRTPSEKALKRKIEEEIKKQPHRKSPKHLKKGSGVSEGMGEPVPKIPSSKLKKAKESGLMTPLHGKSAKEKERILKGLAGLGLPLPEATTLSEKNLIKNVRKEMGLPPEPGTPSMKKRYAKAAATGVLVPLEGLTPAEKEKLLRAQAKLGIPLPEGRTSSEKSLINKIKKESALSKVPPEKLQRAKEAGLLTPLQGKSQAEKERIIRGLAKSGIPLPEGQTASEKSLINKIKSEFGSPSLGRHLSKESTPKVQDRKLLTPLTGKTSAQKEEILRGLAEAGLPLPEGKTSAERALIKKVKETLPVMVKEQGSGVDVHDKKDLTKCERACGCDKKKIRFKHSYVKIKVTSPDISALCPCTDECIPGVEGGIIIDNEGIKVLIESAVGIPQYRPSSNVVSDTHNERQINNTNYIPMVVSPLHEIPYTYSNLLKSVYQGNSLTSEHWNESQDYLLDIPVTDNNLSGERYHENRPYAVKLVQSFSNNKMWSIDKGIQGHKPGHYNKSSNLRSYFSSHNIIPIISSEDSFDSIKIIKWEPSLSFSSSYEETDSGSIISFAASDPSSNSTYFLSISNFDFHNSTILESELFTNGVEYCAVDTNTSSEFLIQSKIATSKRRNKLIKRNQMPDDVFGVFPMSSTNTSALNVTKNNSRCKENVGEPVIIITNLNSSLDLTSVVDDLIAKKEFNEASSLFVVVPTSDEEENEIRTAELGSTQCVQLSENCYNWNNLRDAEPCLACRRTSSKTQSLRITSRQKQYFTEKNPTTALSSMNNWQMYPGHQGVSMDTTQDRPCCCGTDQCGPCTNVMSEVITPVSINRGPESGVFSTPRTNIIQQASFVSTKRSASLSVDRIPESQRQSSSEEKIGQNSYDHPLPQHLKYFKKLLQRNLSPRIMNKILKELDAEQLNNSSLDESSSSPTECSPQDSLLSNPSGTSDKSDTYSILERDLAQQSSFLSTSTISRCETVRCNGPNTCDSLEEILQHPPKDLVGLNCGEKLKYILEQIEAGNQQYIDWEEAVKTEDYQTKIGKPDLVSISECLIPPCKLRSGCHEPGEVLQYPFGTPLPPNLVKLKDLLEQNCDPKKVKLLFDQIESGNLKNIDWESAINMQTDCPIDVEPSSDLISTSPLKCRIPPCHGHSSCHLPDEVLQYPFGTPLSKNLEKLKQLVEQNCNPKKVKDILEQMEAGNLENIDWKEAIKAEDIVAGAEQRGLVDDKSYPKCSISPCKAHSGCHHPDEVLQYPFGTPLPPSLVKLKELLEQNCDPKKVKYLFEQIESGNFKNIDWESALNMPTDDPINLESSSELLSTSATSCKIPPCKGHSSCHSPDELLQYPFGTPLSENLENLKKLAERNCSPRKLKEILEKMETGNVQDIDWKDALETEELATAPDRSNLQDAHKPKCSIPPCKAHSGCHHPDEVLQYPFGTPLPPSLVKLKELLEQNSDPKKVKHLFEQIESGNLKNIDWESALNIHSDRPRDISPPSDPVPPTLKHRVPPCRGHPGCHSPDESSVQQPFGTPQSKDLEILKKLIEQTCCPKKMKDIRRRPIDVSLSSELIPPLLKRQVPQYQTHSGYHLPDEILQYPFDTPLSHDLQKLKMLVERNCSPKQAKDIFEQMESGNLQDTDWEDTLKTEDFSTDPGQYDLVDDDKQKCLISSCGIQQSGCHRPYDVVQYPYGFPLPPNLLKLKNLLEQYSDPRKVKYLFDQIESGKLDSIDFESAMRIRNNCPFDIGPPSDSLPPSLKCRFGTCQNYMNDSSHNIFSQLKAMSSMRNSTCLQPAESTVRPCDCEPCPECPDIPDKATQCPLQNDFPPYLIDLNNLLEENSSSIIIANLRRLLETENSKSDDEAGAFTQTFPRSPNKTCSTSKLTPNVPEKSFECPRGNSLPQHLGQLKDILENNKNSKRMRKTFQMTETGKYKNFDCEGDTEPYTELPPNDPELQDHVYQKKAGCHLSDEVLQYPYDIPLPTQLAKLKTFLEENSNPKEVKDLFRQIEGNLKKPSPYDYSKPELVATVSTCQIPPCRRQNCHVPDEVLEYPFGTPLPEPLLKLKNLLEQTNNPKKVQEIWKQMEAGNFQDLQWEDNMAATSDFQPNYNPRSVPEQTRLQCRMPPCGRYSEPCLPDDDLENRFDLPSPQDLVQLKKILERDGGPELIKQLIKQIQADQIRNMRSVGCGENIKTSPVNKTNVCTPPVSTVAGKKCTPGGRPPAVHPKAVTQPGVPAPIRQPIPVVLPPKAFTPTHPNHAPPGRSPAAPLTVVLKPGAVRPGASAPIRLPIPVVVPPEVYAPPPKDEDCAACHKPKYRNGIKMKCACSGKKKNVKIKKPCPCEVHKLPISKPEPGLKVETHSLGEQCCICDDYLSESKKSGKDQIFKLGQTAPSIIGTPGGPVSTAVQGGTGCIICPTGMPCSSDHTSCPKLSSIKISPIPLGFYGQPGKVEMGELEIIGPQGGYVIMGPDGIYTQSGIKVIKFSTGTDPHNDNVAAESNTKKRKNCLCIGRRGRRKRKITCQCPEEREESDTEPVLLYTYDDYEEARKLAKQYKSHLTQTTSGFKFKKNKKPKPEPPVEYTVEDAIRDYAIIRPDFIRSLVPPGVSRVNKKDCVCEEDIGVGQYEILKKNAKGEFELENKPVEEVPVEVPLKGLKFTVGGKGSASRGLKGICCFEMYQDP